MPDPARVRVARSGGVTRYYAVCRSCRWSGDLKAIHSVAEAEARDHQCPNETDDSHGSHVSPSHGR